MSKQSQITTKAKVEDALFRLRGSIESSVIDRRAVRTLERIDAASEKEKIGLKKKHATLIDQFVKMHEFDKHFLLAESLPTKFAAMSIKMAKDLIRENSCTTTTEKSLVEITVNAFCRGLHLSSLLSGVLNRDSVSVETNFVNYYNFLSKELDKANRLYLMSLTTLQQLKSPPLKVNLNVNTAIVGQNQQFNSIKDLKSETNKPN